MKQIRKRLTYANVMSSIAVFLVLGGATAFAAAQLGKNSVGTKQLKKNAVTTAKLKKNAVTAAKIRNGAVISAKLADGSVITGKIVDGAVTNGKLADASVTSAKLADASVTSAKLGDASVTNGKLAANAVTGNKVQDGSISGSDINQSTLGSVKAGNVYSALFEATGSQLARASDPGIKSGGCFIACAVEFPRDVSDCIATVSSADSSNSVSGTPAMGEAINSSTPDRVIVVMYDKDGNIISHDFALTVVCPTTT